MKYSYAYKHDPNYILSNLHENCVKAKKSGQYNKFVATHKLNGTNKVVSAEDLQKTSNSTFYIEMADGSLRGSTCLSHSHSNFL